MAGALVHGEECANGFGHPLNRIRRPAWVKVGLGCGRLCDAVVAVGSLPPTPVSATCSRFTPADLRTTRSRSSLRRTFTNVNKHLVRGRAAMQERCGV